MDTIEKIEKDFDKMSTPTTAPYDYEDIHLRILIQIAYELRKLANRSEV